MLIKIFPMIHSSPSSLSFSITSTHFLPAAIFCLPSRLLMSISTKQKPLLLRSGWATAGPHLGAEQIIQKVWMHSESITRGIAAVEQTITWGNEARHSAIASHTFNRKPLWALGQRHHRRCSFCLRKKEMETGRGDSSTKKTAMFPFAMPTFKVVLLQGVLYLFRSWFDNVSFLY